MESAEPFLRQTGCPAVEIRGGSIAVDDIERILSHPLHARLEAELVAAAVIALTGANPLEQTVRIMMDGEPVEGAVVSIDQIVTKLTDASGDARFACVLPGEHLLTVAIPGERRARLVPISVTGGSPLVLSLEP
ncbi:MAG TPA: carboxypeptidase regulatory-like domain-containing protein [Candidatus Eisenbacteria bacterium]|uniref:Carboxypeptidase regulatory-like domain-containing protein n=1 Tax=Eiseniibacteriota bacterium TaxID=2212470 RepID=A0A7V2F490_UNCEI|nr:carboxypeptidase regulatory-like domain-containing protein [Candidatus Eisenbacteria bacterium]